MKRIITLLLLLAITGQVTSIFYSKPVEIKLVHEPEDKKEKESKDDKKEEKPFTPYSCSFQQKISDKDRFALALIINVPSPVIGVLTPPPDATPAV